MQTFFWIVVWPAIIVAVFIIATPPSPYPPKPEKPPRPRVPAEMPLWKALGVVLIVGTVTTLVLMPFFPH
jgi:hypothetical protein